jgi:photosystem II stability/assembly factor-like uncharacterized protein
MKGVFSMTVCLSPNGSTAYEGTVPADEVLIGTVDGIARLRPDDRDGSWQVVDRHLQGLHISSILFEPVQGALFAGVHGEGLYFSADGGESWEPRMAGLTAKHVYSLASTQAGSVVLYAGTEPAHLFQSLDYGLNWTELPALRQVPDTDRWTFPAPPHSGHVKTMAFDPRDPRVLFVGIEQGALLKSSDAGRTWRELSGYSKPDDHAYKDVHRVVVRPANPDDVYMTSGIGFYASHDAGETWEHITDRGSRIGYPDQFLISPLDDRMLFMAGSATSPGSWRTSHQADSTVLRSVDGGRGWEPAGQGLPDSMRGNIEAMSLSSYPGGFTLFAATTGGDLFASEDQAQSWRRIAAGLAPISKVGHYRALQDAAA